MIELLVHFASVIISAVIITIIVLLINRIERKRHGDYHITCEYMRFRYSYNKMDECIAELCKLGADGWEIATCAGEDSFAAYLILKRETLHKSKQP
ncbi:hypothetical protein [Duncaniella muris]|uniref:hypothetical protein n=1 Tax=Duncaniella muris TaxID=2094150 RepID=UPI003F676809